jgi:hypothetical protein
VWPDAARPFGSVVPGGSATSRSRPPLTCTATWCRRPAAGRVTPSTGHSAPTRTRRPDACTRARRPAGHSGRDYSKCRKHCQSRLDSVPRPASVPGICPSRAGACAPPQVRDRATGESACRPGSVRPLARADGHPSTTAVADSLLRSTREHRAGRPQALARACFLGTRALLDLAPGGVYQAARVTPGAGGLLHHRFTLTSGQAGGGLFSVALSRGSPRVGVTDHPALRSPDLPRRCPCGQRRGRPADSPVAGFRIGRLPWPRGPRGQAGLFGAGPAKGHAHSRQPRLRGNERSPATAASQAGTAPTGSDLPAGRRTPPRARSRTARPSAAVSAGTLPTSAGWTSAGSCWAGWRRAGCWPWTRFAAWPGPRSWRRS